MTVVGRVLHRALRALRLGPIPIMLLAWLVIAKMALTAAAAILVVIGSFIAGLVPEELREAAQQASPHWGTPAEAGSPFEAFSGLFLSLGIDVFVLALLLFFSETFLRVFAPERLRPAREDNAR